MLSIVCWYWPSPLRNREFKAQYVNALFNMVSKHLTIPHRFVCMTDMPEGLDGRIDVMPLPGYFSGVNSKEPEGFPACYQRLWLFSEEAADAFDGHVVNIDVDVVITRNIDHLFDRDEDFVGWKGSNIPGIRYSGGLWMHKPGTRTHVFNDFDPLTSPQITMDAGLRGSDQAWISYCLGEGESTWGHEDGVVRCRDYKRNDPLPTIIQTATVIKPWTTMFQRKFRRLGQIWSLAAMKEPEKPHKAKRKKKGGKKPEKSNPGEVIERKDVQDNE